MIVQAALAVALAMGPMTDVSTHWQRYQPATAFCVKPDVKQYAQGGDGATDTGADPVCAASGFAADDKGLVKITVNAPPLCAGCRRLFFDFSKATAKGHAYYHLAAADPGLTVDPIAHSPNTKNFTNDKLVAPDGSLQDQIVGAFDTHAVSYVTDTAHFTHTVAQGPYYIGPWYLNRDGERIQGVYLDVNSASPVGYMAGYNSGQLCANDDDAYYVGCVDASGGST
jgi:hypothetical protein